MALIKSILEKVISADYYVRSYIVNNRFIPNYKNIVTVFL